MPSSEDIFDPNRPNTVGFEVPTEHLPTVAWALYESFSRAVFALAKAHGGRGEWYDELYNEVQGVLLNGEITERVNGQVVPTDRKRLSPQFRSAASAIDAAFDRIKFEESR